MNKKNLIFLTSGVVGGVLLMLFVMYISAEGIMLKEKPVNMNFEQAVELFEKTTLEHGWKIPTVHDLQATMTKFGKNVKKVKVFEICHPNHAYKILSRDDERIVSSMMPCRVAIYEKSDGKVHVSWMNTGLMGGLMKGIVPEVMNDASDESKKIIDVLLSK